MDHPIWIERTAEPAGTRGEGAGPGLSPLEALCRGLRPTGAILFTTLLTTAAPAPSEAWRVRRFVEGPEAPHAGAVERRGLVRRGVCWLLGR